jgi:glyoxylase-like metal-dependent hydrolase (beta-lactamase superfamily II)
MVRGGVIWDMNATREWYATDWVDEHSLRMVEAEVYGTFAVYGTDETLLVDTGTGVGDLRSVVTAHSKAPVRVFLTHSHWDHVGGATAFDRVGIHPAERTDDGRVIIDVLSDEFNERPTTFVADWRAEGNEFPDGFDPDSFGIDPVTDVEAVRPGETFDLGDRTLEVLHLPGHSPGHQGVLDPESRILYGSDVVSVDGDLVALFEDSDLEEYVETVDRLLALHEEGAFETLATSHNPPYAGDRVDVLDAARSVLESALGGADSFVTVETPWGDARRYEVDGTGLIVR